MKYKNFTFQTVKPTGAYKAFFASDHHIKLNGEVCGSIEDNAPYKVRFMKVKADIMQDKNPNCTWMWTAIKMEFSSVQDAKNWVKDNSEKIQKAINIYQQKD